MPTQTNDPARRAASRFAKYANGKAYRWTRGEDYTCKTETIRRYAYRWGEAHGFITRVSMCGDSVVIQFVRRVNSNSGRSDR